jgi:hypothetical protein
VYEVRQRMLRERVEGLLEQAEEYQDDECSRLALLVLTLLDRHTLDGKGRCRHCRRFPSWWRGSRRCTVLPLLAFYLEQPREFLDADR